MVCKLRKILKDDPSGQNLVADLAICADHSVDGRLPAAAIWVVDQVHETRGHVSLYIGGSLRSREGGASLRKKLAQGHDQPTPSEERQAAPSLGGPVTLTGLGECEMVRRACEPIGTTRLWLNATPSSGIQLGSAGSVARPTGATLNRQTDNDRTPTRLSRPRPVDALGA